MSDDRSDSNLRKDIKDVLSTGFYVQLVLSLLAGVSLQTVIIKALSPGSLDAEGLLSMAHILVLTAPLTLAIAIVGSVLLGPTRYGIKYDNGVHLRSVGIAVLVFVGTAWLCNQLGIGAPGVTDQDMANDAGKIHGNPAPIMLLNWIFLLLARYFTAYRALAFLSSIVLGAYLAWAFGTKLVPHFTEAWH